MTGNADEIRENAGKTTGPAAACGPEESASEKKVCLTVTGRQTDPDGRTQTTTSVYEALHERRGDAHIFRYPSEDGAETTLLVSGNLVWQEKSFTGRQAGFRAGSRRAASGTGPSAAAMVFDPSRAATRCNYETFCGTIPMEIRTERITIMGGRSPQPGHLRARVRYRLVLDPDYALSCSVTIRADLT